MTLSPNQKQYIAHVRKSDGAKQSLLDHLTGTAELAKQFANKIGLPLSGELIGLVHDLGKYSDDFQIYIKSATGIFNPDIDDEYVDTKGLKGKIDHSTAGGQFVAHLIAEYQRQKNITETHALILLQVLVICIFSHHSGLINILDKNGNAIFNKRLREKKEADSHIQECQKSMSSKIDGYARELVATILDSEVKSLAKFIEPNNPKITAFYQGFLTRLLFSCLIDADRSNSIAFEYPQQTHELTFVKPNWQTAINDIETLYANFAKTHQNAFNPINEKRNEIAQTCLKKSQLNQGVFTLTVPTGGGKTEASLRFAVNHAKKHNLDRIIYIIPFTNIIEQNAQRVRKILETQSNYGEWVLEQHSNLEPNVQTWQSKLIADNWNAPIVFTTMVQFLESCFGGGTKGVRRLHQMTNAVLIFDEIQTLPINCYYLFNNAVNFLSQFCRSSIVLCTATQPVLDKLPHTNKGRLKLASDYEIIGDSESLSNLFTTLDRVDVHDCTTSEGQTIEVLSDFIKTKLQIYESVLVIVNTKIWAKNLFKQLKDELFGFKIYHLSTGQCAKHRKVLVSEIKQRLKQGLPTLVISTQLIEAGVDISFNCVIRFLAGLDSIAQAAGRCNRNGELVDSDGNSVKGQVFIVNPDNESLGSLLTIKVGQDCTRLILLDAKKENSKKNLLHPDYIKQYFNYFIQHETLQRQMSYPVDVGNNKFDSKGTGGYSVLDWLSDNASNTGKHPTTKPMLQQSFMDAGRAFKAIDAPTYSIIVPYGEDGNELIKDLLATKVVTKDFYQLVKKAQQYSINLYEQDWTAIKNGRQQILDTGIYVLTFDSFYDQEFGLNVDGDSYSAPSFF